MIRCRVSSSYLCVFVELSVSNGGFCRFVLVQGPFDLCVTAGLGVAVSVGSCRSLISPVLSHTQLIDSTLWCSAGKLSGPVR